MWHSPGKVQGHAIVYFPLVPTSFSFKSSSIQVANLACSISNNEEGVKLVRMAATQIDSLCPQVSLIYFVSKAWYFRSSTLQPSCHSFPCLALFPLARKCYPTFMGHFRFCLSQKELQTIPVSSELLWRLFSFPLLLTFFYLSWTVVSMLHIYLPLVSQPLNYMLAHVEQDFYFCHICAK